MRGRALICARLAAFLAVLFGASVSGRTGKETLQKAGGYPVLAIKRTLYKGVAHFEKRCL
jgi:hypothetical protein